jgi:hypothetical protein
MKHLFTTSVFALGLVLTLGGSAFAQNAVATPPSTNELKPTVAAQPAPAAEAAKPGGGIFKFEEETHDFGEMMQGGDASYTFKFQNVGTEDIVITLAKGSCGCTVPEWSKDPVHPGETGEIAVKYDSNRIGGINRNVTLISNAAGGEKVLYIKGNISPKPAEPDYTAPAATPAVPAGGH